MGVALRLLLAAVEDLLDGIAFLRVDVLGVFVRADQNAPLGIAFVRMMMRGPLGLAADQGADVGPALVRVVMRRAFALAADELFRLRIALVRVVVADLLFTADQGTYGRVAGVRVLMRLLAAEDLPAVLIDGGAGGRLNKTAREKRERHGQRERKSQARPFLFSPGPFLSVFQLVPLLSAFPFPCRSFPTRSGCQII